MTEQLTSEFKQMRYDTSSIVNDLIHQTAADNLPVIPSPAPEPAPVVDTATYADGSSNDEMIKIDSATTATKLPR